MHSTIGLQAYKKLVVPLIQKGMPISFKISPSSVDFGQVLALSNSMLCSELPPELTPPKISLVPPEMDSVIVPRFNTLKYIIKDQMVDEKNYNAATVNSHIYLARQILLSQRRLSPLALNRLSQHFKGLSYAAILKHKYLFYMIGCVDDTWTGSFPLPATVAVPNGYYDNYKSTELLAMCDSSLRVDGYNFFPILNDAKVRNLPGFKILKPNLVFPCAHVCIDHKKDGMGDAYTREDYVGQCALHLVSSSISVAYYSGTDHPMLVVGLVSDGRSYDMLAFQLNTLDFEPDTTQKNYFWRKRLTMLDTQGKFNPEALNHLVKLFSFIHDAQLQGKN